MDRLFELPDAGRRASRGVLARSNGLRWRLPIVARRLLAPLTAFTSLAAFTAVAALAPVATAAAAAPTAALSVVARGAPMWRTRTLGLWGARLLHLGLLDALLRLAFTAALRFALATLRLAPGTGLALRPVGTRLPLTVLPRRTVWATLASLLLASGSLLGPAFAAAAGTVAVAVAPIAPPAVSVIGPRFTRNCLRRADLRGRRCGGLLAPEPAEDAIDDS